MKKLIHAMVFLTPFVVFRYIFHPLSLSKFFFLEMATIVLGLLFVADILFGKQKKFPKNIVFLTFGLYVVSMLISALRSVSPSLSFWGSMDHGTGVIFMLCLLLLSVIITTYFKTKDDWMNLFKTFLISGLVFNVGTLVDFAGLGLMKGFYANPSNGFTIGNSSWAGFYLGFVFFISAGFIFSARNKADRWIGIFTLATTILNPTITSFFAPVPDQANRIVGFARAAFVSIVAGIGIFGLYIPFRKIKSDYTRKILLYLLMVIILAGGAFAIIRQDALRNVIEKTAGPNRLIFWNIAVEGFKDKPIFGWGGDTYQHLYSKYFDATITSPGYSPEYWVDRSHNIYFDELAMGGAIGFILLMGVYLVMLYGLGKKALEHREDKMGYLYMGLFVAVISFLIQGVMLFQTSVAWFDIMLVLAFCASMCFDSKEDDKGKKKRISEGLKYLILIVAIIASIVLYIYMVAKPLKVAKKLVRFMNAPYQYRMEFYPMLEKAYLGGTTDMGNVFSPYHIRLRNMLEDGLVKEEEMPLMYKEIDAINKLLDLALEKQGYMDMKILMSQVGFYSLKTAMTEGDLRQENYKKGMWYISKMEELNTENPIVNTSKVMMEYSRIYGIDGLSVIETRNLLKKNE